jgi:hypothetical protein
MAAGLAAAAVLLLQVIPALAAEKDEAAPRLFLERIYAQYTGQADTGGVDLSSEAEIRRLFDPPLATLILADRHQSETNGEPAELDGDPFVDAQDWVISGLKITIPHATATEASADIRFTNFDQPNQVHIDLVHLADGWRVHQITYATTTLTRILTGR